jgi:hypothetical protein
MKLCSIYQDIISFQLDSGKQLPGWLENHCVTCEDCRSYRSTQSALVHQLESDAQSAVENPSPFLHGKIMSAIDRSEHEVESVPESFNPVWRNAVGVSAAVLICFALLKTTTTPDDQQTSGQVASVATTDPVNENGFTGYSFAKIKPLEAWDVDLNKPLEDEMNYAIADAKTAINALADTFLSEAMKESLMVASRN